MAEPRRARLVSFLTALVIGLGVPMAAWAGTDPALLAESPPIAVPARDPAREGGALKYDGTAGLLLLAGALVSAALPAELEKEPPACRWCDRGALNLIDRWAEKAKWDEPCKAARLSYLGLGTAGALALGPMSRESNHRDWLENAGVVADSAAVTVVLTQIVKYAVRRDRPASNPCLEEGSNEHDRNLSFFSGHTAVAFAVVASAHETARLRGRSTDDWLWAGGGAAALTGYLRIAGNRHHFLDVLAGAGVGYAVGRWVPRHLLRRPAPGPLVAGSASGVAPPSAFFAYTRQVGRDGDLLLQVGKGPGKSILLRVGF